MSITLVIPESREEYAAIVAFYGALAPKYGGEQPAKVEISAGVNISRSEIAAATRVIPTATKEVPVTETKSEPTPGPAEPGPTRVETVSLDFVREKIAAATKKDEDNRGKIVAWIKGQGFKNLPSLDPEKYTELLTFIAAL